MAKRLRMAQTLPSRKPEFLVYFVSHIISRNDRAHTTVTKCHAAGTSLLTDRVDDMRWTHLSQNGFMITQQLPSYCTIFNEAAAGRNA